MLLTPNIESAYICGDENFVGLTDLSSLNLVPFMFEPHSNKSSSSAEKLKENYDLAMASEDDALGIVDDVKLIVGTPEHLVRGVLYWGQIAKYSNIRINCDLTPYCVDVTKKVSTDIFGKYECLFCATQVEYIFI